MKKAYIIFLSLLAIFCFALPLSAQESKEKFDPSDDFRKSYPSELKKQPGWSSDKSRGSGAFRENYKKPQGAQTGYPQKHEVENKQYGTQTPSAEAGKSGKKTTQRPPSNTQRESSPKSSPSGTWSPPPKAAAEERRYVPEPYQEDDYKLPPQSIAPAQTQFDNGAGEYSPPAQYYEQNETGQARQAETRPQPAYQSTDDYMPPTGYYGGANTTSSTKTPREDSRPSETRDDLSLDEPRDYQNQDYTPQENVPVQRQQTEPAQAIERAEPTLSEPLGETPTIEAEARQEETIQTMPESRLPENSEEIIAVRPLAPQAINMVSSADATDYSNNDSWMYLPQEPSSSVDIFFLYTGSCQKPGVCSVSDAAMRQKALESTLQQAGVFEPLGNLFAPYYRQLNSGIFLGLKPGDRAQRLAVSSVDAIASFDYYIKNYNQGRPFILAAHGQGSAALLDGILSQYFQYNPEVRGQMVAAYAIGYSVTRDYLSSNHHLRIAERRNDVGVIISYSTEAVGVKATNPVVLAGSIAINPVNWTRSTRRALQEHSKGANLTVFGEDEYKENFADAKVDMARGVIECSTANLDQYSSPDYPHGAFPNGDYAFYYYDLRANAQERIDAYMQRRP